MVNLFPRRKTSFRHQSHFENVLGTSLDIQVIASLETAGPDVESAVLREIDRLDAIFNAYDPNSELCRWQSSLETEVAVSCELALVLESAEVWRSRTAGAFNPAVEALTRIWKMAEKENQVVSPGEIETLAAQIRAPLWNVERQHQTAQRITKCPVTLNSIAKGFILDRAAQVGASIEGVEQILVNIGGDIRHCGTKKAAISVGEPRNAAENAPGASSLSICNQGIATSGNYRRGFRVGDRWFSHLIDPRTGWPVEAAVSVSVVAPSALEADVLATVFSVLEPEKSLEMADSLASVGVFLINREGARFSNPFWRALECP